MPLTVSIRVSGYSGSSSCQPGTPDNCTEVKAITTAIVKVNGPVHTTVAGGGVVVVVI